MASTMDWAGVVLAILDRLLEALPATERQDLLDYARFKANRKRAPQRQS